MCVCINGAMFDLLIGSHLILGMTGRIIDTLISVLALRARRKGSLDFLCVFRMLEMIHGNVLSYVLVQRD